LIEHLRKGWAGDAAFERPSTLLFAITVVPPPWITTTPDAKARSGAPRPDARL
jgi:hypothetical protein